MGDIFGVESRECRDPFMKRSLLKTQLKKCLNPHRQTMRIAHFNPLGQSRNSFH